MYKYVALSIFLLVFGVSSASAGYFKSSIDSRGAASAAVEIEGNGIYNLIVSVQFLKQPYDKKEYDNDNYEELINRLTVEWRGLALNKVLESNNYKISDLAALKKQVESEIQSLINSSKSKHGVNQKTEVIYSITSFVLVSTTD